MGSTISNIADKIKEHGSWDAYQKYLLENAFVESPPVYHQVRDTLRSSPVFEDSEGNTVRDGARIKIIKCMTSSRYDGCETTVRWSAKNGRYEFQSPHVPHSYWGFEIIKKFRVLGY